MKKLVAETNIVRGDFAAIGLGTQAKLAADTDYTYNNDLGRYQRKENGKLSFSKTLMTFCTAGFARAFSLKAKELREVFGKNTISRVRITIEVLETEEWEYTK